MNPTQSTKDLSELLSHLSANMKQVAVVMSTYRSSTEILKHSKELMGAAYIASEWAKKLTAKQDQQELAMQA